MRLPFSFCLLLLLTARAFAGDPAPAYFEDVQQDSQGVLWAFSRAQYDHIYSYDGAHWSTRSAPLDRAMPEGVVRLADGAIACIWRAGEHQVAVTRHLGNDVKVIGTCDGDLPNSGLTVRPLADSQNRVWITGEFPHVYRADGKGGPMLAYDIPPEQFNKPLQGYNRIFAVEDARGRIWVWSNRRASNYASLRGVLIFTGDKAELHDTFSTVKGSQILAIARADDRHMWVAVSNDGLYKVDIDSFQAERVTDPAPKAFSSIRELHAGDGDVYAVADVPPFQDSLWRLHAGEWKKIIPIFDRHSFAFSPRSWLAIKSGGSLVQSYGNGLWYIPEHGEPAQLTWRSGFPLEQAHSLNQLPDGTFFAMGHDEQIFHGPLALPPHDRENTRIEHLDTDRTWTVDASGHLWIVPRTSPPALQMWDGQKWISHPVPTGSAPGQMPSLLGDKEGRLWMPLNPVEILDPRTGQWQNFPNMTDAYVALRNNPPHWLPNDAFICDPQYSPDGKRIAARTGVAQLDYYDGAAWRHLRRDQITGQRNDNAVGPPWFDQNGKLCVNLRNHMTWRMDDAGKWSEITFQSHYPDDIWSEGRNIPGPVPPDGCVTSQPDSIVADNLGFFWLTWQGGLYRCMPGLCVSVFGADEINPFHARRLLRHVFVDKDGNAFLETASEGMDYFMIRPESPPPRTRIVMKKEQADSFTAHLDSQTKLPVTYRWQLDQGPLQMGKDKILPLNHLSNGPHLLKVTAIDGQLNMDPTPATARFEVKIDSAKQIRLLIAQLADPDFDKRKEAVKALARQPSTALPALRSARQTASESQQWWIDAALQEIENQTATSSAPGRCP